MPGDCRSVYASDMFPVVEMCCVGLIVLIIRLLALLEIPRRAIALLLSCFGLCVVYAHVAVCHFSDTCFHLGHCD
jgi:hypothetical protein